MLGIGDEKTARSMSFIPRVLATLVTFHVVVLGWVFFRSADFSIAFEYFAGILRFDELTSIGLTPLVVAAALLVIDIPQDKFNDHTVFLRLPWWLQSPIYATACFAMLLYGGREIPFIYFQF
jgi:hypothetical protein